MSIIFGQKIGMTQVFGPDGATVPVTIVSIPKTHVTQIKTVESDGYVAVQVGTRVEADAKKAEKAIAKPQQGHLKASGVMARKLYEFKVEPKELETLKVGAEIAFDGLAAGHSIQIQGTSKGRGFAGVVKRHHFKGGPASHGHKDNLRRPGSIGAGHPQHVMKGTRMAGHMGDATASIKNLEVISVDAEKRLVLVKGSVPGAVRSWLMIRPTGKDVRHPTKDRKALPSTQAASDKKSAAKEAKK